MKEQMRGEMEAFEPLFEEMEFISNIFDDNSRYKYYLILIKKPLLCNLLYNAQ